jgi:hypothetical protein
MGTSNHKNCGVYNEYLEQTRRPGGLFFWASGPKEKCRTLLKSGEHLPETHQDQPLIKGKADMIRIFFKCSYRRN